MNGTNKYAQRPALRCNRLAERQEMNARADRCVVVAGSSEELNEMNGQEWLNDLNGSSLNEKDMKTTINNFRRACQACAEAHRVAFVENGSKFGVEKYWRIKSATVPVFADLEMICEAFGCEHAAFLAFGETFICWFDLVERQDNDVDMELLRPALPYGTTI